MKNIFLGSFARFTTVHQKIAPKSNACDFMKISRADADFLALLPLIVLEMLFNSHPSNTSRGKSIFYHNLVFYFFLQ